MIVPIFRSISKACRMKQTLVLGSILFLIPVLLSSCASEDILKALKIDTPSQKEKKTADQKTIADLNKQLARAQKNETKLNAEINKLKNMIAEQETLFENKEASYSLQIGTLKSKLDEKEALISIQGKVIGLLDDADKTLQKSIEDQLKDR